jgi:hypothetical protein
MLRRSKKEIGRGKTGIFIPNEWRKIMNYLRQSWWTRYALFTLVCLIMLAVPFAKLAKAAHPHEGIQIADLAGTWQAALLWSNSGCGPASGLLTFTLPASGSTSSATLVGHAGAGPGCGDQTTTQTFVIHSLNTNGSGKAGLTCGVACGWELTIQVDRSRNLFNLVDVDPANPNNFVEGTAIRQFKEHNDSD